MLSRKLLIARGWLIADLFQSVIEVAIFGMRQDCFILRWLSLIDTYRPCVAYSVMRA